MWAFPDPGVTQVKIHNAATSLQNLNKAVTSSSAALQTHWKKIFFPRSRNVFIVGRPPDKAIGGHMNYRQQWVRPVSVGEGSLCVCASSNIPILYLTDGNVLLTEDHS